MPLNENDFYTELDDGTFVPVREVGTRYVAAFDCMDKGLFLSYLENLLGAEEATQYEEDDILWVTAESIRFDPAPDIQFGEYDSFTAAHITVLKRW